ncbi:MAG: hypothetical protein J0H69_19960 [Burkholderiales bacterium]|nr:hypothetical protein [Burkholderiales bacterium]
MSGSNSSPPTGAAAPLPPADEPLAFTVHSMPSPQSLGGNTARTRSGRWKMIGVLLMCAAPVIASYFTYYVIRPDGRTAFGELVEQRPMPPIVARTLDGREVPLTSLRHQWLLVSASASACAERCQTNLYLQRQLRESVGREKDRVDWVWLVTDEGAVPDTLRPALANATVLRVDPAALQKWVEPAAGHALEDHLYVIDPMGNWMMRFPPALDAKSAARAKRDLERLLRASSSWDQAGRPVQD